LRNRPDNQLTNGPAKLAQALAIDGSFNSVDICAADSLIWIEEGGAIAAGEIRTGPRVGLGQTPEPWFSMPWRYWIDGNPYVSR